MSVGGVATMTAVRIKELSTSVFVKFARRLSKNDFIHRNRRVLVICLIIWLVANAAGFFIYRNTLARSNNEFYQKGLSAARNLAAESGPFVLEKDILALNVAIKELAKASDLKSAVVLDHENTILTHTDTEMINRKFEPPKNQKTIDVIDSTTITAGALPDKTEIMGFARNITFA